MDHLANGGSLAVELEEWMHKSSGRASLLLTALDEDGEVVGTREWPWIFLPYADYAVELPRMFPWANLMMDDEADWDSYESECAIWDKEDQRFFYVETYDEWQTYQGYLGLRAAWTTARWPAGVSTLNCRTWASVSDTRRVPVERSDPRPLQ